MEQINCQPGTQGALVYRGGDPPTILANTDLQTSINLSFSQSVGSNQLGDFITLSPQSWLAMEGADDIYAATPPGSNTAVLFKIKGGQGYFQSGIVGGTLNFQNITADSVHASDLGMGLLFLTDGSVGPGNVITTTVINNAITAGYQGLYLDSRFIWDMSGLVINGISNFKIVSNMKGSIGWNGIVKYNSQGYIKTDTGAPQDGIQIYASNPTGAPTQGFEFIGCVFVGSNSRAVIHQGGGQRQCCFPDGSCLVYNTASTANAFAMIVGSGIVDNNSEDALCNVKLAGNWGALGIGVVDITQKSNDCLWDGLVTSSNQYSIYHSQGGNHHFSNYYDRSNPSIAVIYNHGSGRLSFESGELQNQNAVGQIYVSDGTGQATFDDVTVTVAAGNTVSIAVIGPGPSTIAFRGNGGANGAQQWQIGTGCTCDVSDPLFAAGNVTISGTSGAFVSIAGQYSSQGSAPTLSGFSAANITYPGLPFGNLSALTLLNGYVNSGSGANAQFRVEGDKIIIFGDVTAPASPNVVMATLPTGLNVPHNQPITVIDRTTNTPTGILRVQGSPASLTMAGQTAAHELAFSGQVCMSG